MYYNLKSFGEEVRKLREKLGYTREKLSEISFVNQDTIRRIESDYKSIPTRDILEDLSIALKEDLNILLLKYRIDDVNLFYDLKTRLENKINDGNSNLDDEISDLKKLYKPEVRNFVQFEIKHLMLLAEGVMAYEDKNYDIALEKFIVAITVNTPNFTLEKYRSFIYSNLEIRVLMNIAFVLNRMDDLELFIDILEFCIASVDSGDPLYYKLCHNVSGGYIRKNDYFIYRPPIPPIVSWQIQV